MAYATAAEVDAFAKTIGRTEWLDLSDDQKNRAMDEAVYDMIRIHGQPNDEDAGVQTEWLVTDVFLIEAFKRQSIYVGKQQGNRDLAENMNATTNGSFAGSISTARPASRKIDPIALRLIITVVRDAIQQNIIETGFQFDSPVGNRFGRG